MRCYIVRSLYLLSLGLSIGVCAFAWPLVAVSQDKIPKFVLIKLTRDQTHTVCRSEVYTQCMAFTEKKCVDLAEKAIEKCLGPLPDQIDPNSLQNSTLEQCPQGVYEKEGFSEEKAKECFDKAMEAAAG